MTSFTYGLENSILEETREVAHANLVAALTGVLPWEFGWVVVFNDLIWWRAFGLFVARAAERSGGWREFLRGSLSGVTPLAM